MADRKKKLKKGRDKKRRVPALKEARRGVLPSSVQALLGYLGGGGPAPMQQYGIQPKERAGVDSMETLSNVFKQMSVMNTALMQSAMIKNDIAQIRGQVSNAEEKTQKDLKQNQDESNNAKEESKRILKTMEQKIAETERQIVYQLKLSQEKRKPDRIQNLASKLKDYKQVRAFQQEGVSAISHLFRGEDTGVAMPPAPVSDMNSALRHLESDATTSSSYSPSLAHANAPISIAPASVTTVLSAIDPRSNAIQALKAFSPLKTQPSQAVQTGGGEAEVNASLSKFVFQDANVSSGAAKAGGGAAKPVVSKISSDTVYNCPCGSKVAMSSKSRHEKTDKHTKYELLHNQ